MLCDSDAPSVELERAKKEGAHGYISKSTKRHGFVTAIKRILSEISIESAPIVVDAQARGEHLEHYWSFGLDAVALNTSNPKRVVQNAHYGVHRSPESFWSAL